MNENQTHTPPAPSQEGNGTERDYTRQVYQNLMAVVELLEGKSPLPASHKQIQEALGLSKNIVFDISWNLCKRGWAEEVGDGMVRRRLRTQHNNDAWLGREVKKICNVIQFDESIQIVEQGIKESGIKLLVEEKKTLIDIVKKYLHSMK